MKKALLVLSDIVIIILTEAVSVVLSAFVPLVCLFARWDKEPTTWSGGGDHPDLPYIRGNLPKWASIWETADERLPGDVAMPKTRAILERTSKTFGPKIGRYLTSVWWLFRNRMYGLQWALSGRESDGYFDPSPEPGIRWRESEGIWRWWAKLGPVALHAGWKVHRAHQHAHWQHGPFMAVRFISIKKAR